MKSPKKAVPRASWLDRAKAANSKADFEALLAEVTVSPLTERKRRHLEQRLVKKGPDGKPLTDPAETPNEPFLAACCTLADGSPIVPEGREDDLLDIPTGLYLKLTAAANEANGYILDVEGNV